MRAFARFFKGNSSQIKDIRYAVTSGLLAPMCAAQHGAITTDMSNGLQVDLGIGPAGQVQRPFGQNACVRKSRIRRAEYAARASRKIETD